MACPSAFLRSTGLSLFSGLALAGLISGGNSAVAQQSGYGQTLGTYGTPQPQQPFDGGSGGLDSILDATNPLELMNRIRRGTALDDATPPSSAIDAALRDFEAQSPAAGGSIPSSSAVPPSSLPASGMTPSNQNF